MSELIEYAVGEAESFLVAVEVPPGVGKTRNAVEIAVKQALKGRTVVIALPNHQSLLKAFLYVLSALRRYARSLPKTKLPYVVYYEGINRYCPLITNKKLLAKAIEYLERTGNLDAEIADRLKALNPEDIPRIFSTRFICKYLCPIYRIQRYFDKERIFVTENVKKLVGAREFFVKEHEMEAARLVQLLGEFERRGLVAVLRPGIDPNSGAPLRDAYCIRCILTKAVTSRKTQIVMKGAVILTPIHALPFIVSTVVARVSILRKKLPLPLPLVILDEYDTVFYMMDRFPLLSVRQLELELEYAKKVMREEGEKRRRGDPSYNPENLIAALMAFRILTRVRSEINHAMRLISEKHPQADPRGSIASLFAEVAENPVRFYDELSPPFAPRVLFIPEDLKRIALDVVDFVIRQARRKMEEEGLVYFDENDVKSKSVREFLDLWEAIFVSKLREDGREFPAPVLYREYGAVFKLGYRALKHPFSVAKRVLRFLSKPMLYRDGCYSVAIHYRCRPIECEVRNERGRRVSSWGLALSVGVYDTRFMYVATMPAATLLLSATGLPWQVLDFVLTRSGGVGVAIRGRTTRCADRLITVLRLNEERTEVRKSMVSYIYGFDLPKKVRIVTLTSAIRWQYSKHGIVLAIQNLPWLPQTRDLRRSLPSLVEKLRDYVKVIVEGIAVAVNTVKQLGLRDKVPSILVLVQRKDATEVLARMLFAELRKQGLRAKLEACLGDSCETVRNADLGADLCRSRKLSHFVVSAKLGRFVARVFLTWFRSRFTRGIDLPENHVALVIVGVGTPYRPPEALDIVPPPCERIAISQRASMIAVPLFIKVKEMERCVLVVHNPIEIAESISEFVQAAGRALRRAWYISNLVGRQLYRVAIAVPDYLYNKLRNYSPVWFSDIFLVRLEEGARRK